MKKNRIVIFGWADSVHVQRWCSGLAGRGYLIKLISVVGKPLPDIETVILPHKGKLSYFSNISRAGEEARKFEPDLVHVHYVIGNGLFGLRSKIRPIVTSVWGSDIDKNANNWLGNRIAGKVLKGSDHITATSRYLESLIHKRFDNQNLPVSVIPFGVKVPTGMIPLPDSGQFKICYLKAHKPVYGADILIDAIAEVIKTKPEVRLTIAGEQNSYTEILKQKIEQLNIESFVEFSGQISYEKVHNFIAGHNLMVMPSRSEGFGVAAAEASACARPVVASNIGGIPEIILDGISGILVPPENSKALADAMLKLANDRQLCHKMGQAGYEFVKQNYDWEKSLDQMCQLYERLIYDTRQK